MCLHPDAEALEATTLLARTEGIIPALESAHAIAEVVKRAPGMKEVRCSDVNVSGRGDKILGLCGNHSRWNENSTIFNTEVHRGSTG